MKIYQVSDPEFKEYGRVIPGYELGELIRELEKMPVTKDVAYVPSVAELEKTAAAKELAEEVYGGMPIQIGYCNGHNQKLNALEYHRDSEVNVAVGDLILLLARRQDMEEDFTLDTSRVKAFLVPSGTMIEVYATTLHYAPCQTGEEGFRCIVVLPRGTNEPLAKKPPVKGGEEKLLAACNKWLIGHPEGGLPEGSFLGLKGENVAVQTVPER